MRAPAILVLGVILGLAAPVAAQTTDVSKQCGCDMSAHAPGFDCHAYCCRVSGGAWCGAGQPGVDGPHDPVAAIAALGKPTDRDLTQPPLRLVQIAAGVSGDALRVRKPSRTQ